jgi:SAM-dependent methyltransferase
MPRRPALTCAASGLPGPPDYPTRPVLRSPRRSATLRISTSGDRDDLMLPSVLSGRDHRRVMKPTADATRRSYDRIARSYAARFRHELDDKPFDREFLDAVADAIPRRGWCVDLGCGPSQIGAYLARRGLSILSVDVSQEMLRHASVLLPEGGQVQADMRALPLANGSIAGIVAFYSLVHIPRKELTTTLVELHRVLLRCRLVARAQTDSDPSCTPFLPVALTSR